MERVVSLLMVFLQIAMTDSPHTMLAMQLAIIPLRLWVVDAIPIIVY